MLPTVIMMSVILLYLIERIYSTVQIMIPAKEITSVTRALVICNLR